MRGPERKTIGRARHLRRKATDAETKLWYALRERRLGGFKFVRQEPIGPYVADFVCREGKLVIEVDGSQHAESARDQVRDAFLVGGGYRILRFWNTDVLKHRSGVLEQIFDVLNRPPV